MSSKLQSDWINQVYTDLTDTLANDDHKITSGITKKIYSSTSKITAQSVNDLITSIKSLSDNNFIKKYADCFKNEETLTTPTTKAPIKETTKNEIDNYMEDILKICGNTIATTTGNNNCGDNFFESGCNFCENNYRWPLFWTENGGRGSNGRDNTNNGQGSGCTNRCSAFRRGGCTNQEWATRRIDYGVVIGQPNVLNTNS